MDEELEYEIIDFNDCLVDFDCADEGLNNFLKIKANKQDDPMDCRGTTTLVKLNGIIIGYYTLKNTSLLFKPDGRTLRGIPAIEITYLAIHKDYQRQGYGSTVIQNIIYKTKEYSDLFSSTISLVISSLKDKVEFYENNNFVRFNDIFDLPYDVCRTETEQMFLNLISY